ncbi:alpha/beta fold hydrolase [Kribbella shirazensis]|uniref:Pimeloyl-ACP methyl ester carboxylesterase n=1 Tax=Kribbella shirazensis TaxID=1105143 RepID=A0A7X5V682_9ACTN|nr:alpha/beta hydrolase [Kribbella shirazensis]NIK55285.1 pimeloyl-ACP methyl ester carboxylesterase [Kribbella shirazensis]
MNSPLLFLSGAGLPAWIWDDIRAALPVETSVAAYPRAGSLRDYATKVLAEAPERFVVVAHSIGGVIGTQLVAQAPSRVLGFVGVAASIPQPGQSFLGALPFPNRLLVGAVMRLAGTRPPAKVIRSGLATDLDDEQAARIVKEFSPESQRLYRDAVGDHRFPELRGYVQTTADKELPAALQTGYAANLGTTSVRSLPTGHLPMLADPNALAAALQELL